MYANHDHAHSGLPVQTRSVSITWCPYCQAWRLVGWVATYHNDVDPVITNRLELDAGPFDTWTDVIALASGWLRGLDPCPGSLGLG